MNANKLNDKFDALGLRFDNVYNTLNLSKTDTQYFMALFSDWQDFYWGNLDQWPVNDLAMWNDRYNKAESKLLSLEQQLTPREAPIVSKPSGQVVTVAPTQVYGTWPLWMKVAAGSVLAIGLYAVVRKLKIL